MMNQVTSQVVKAMVVLACLVGGAALERTCVAQTKESISKVASQVREADSHRRIFAAIMGANSQASLLKAVNPSAINSRLVKIVYETRLYQLTGAHASSAILALLPRNDIEMEALNEFLHEPQNSAIRPIYSDFYRAAFDSVSDYPQYLHSVFGIATEYDTKNWPDYDDIDSFCSSLARVYQAQPARYESAASQESEKDRRYVMSCAHGAAP